MAKTHTINDHPMGILETYMVAQCLPLPTEAPPMGPSKGRNCAEATSMATWVSAVHERNAAEPSDRRDGWACISNQELEQETTEDACA